MKHKRYLVFVYGYENTKGGLQDLVGTYDDVQEAFKKGKYAGGEEVEIYDRIEGCRINLHELGDFSAQ